MTGRIVGTASITPLERIAAECRDQILAEWLLVALSALEDAAVLVGDDHAVRHARRARHRTLPWLGLLVPAYGALARRYAHQVLDGRQHDLFAGDTDTVMRNRWAGFAMDFPRGPGRACRQRWILMATIGPFGLDGVDRADVDPALTRVQAANLLVGEIMTAPLSALGR